jgi:hypothetical protein
LINSTSLTEIGQWPALPDGHSGLVPLWESAWALSSVLRLEKQ